MATAHENMANMYTHKGGTLFIHEKLLILSCLYPVPPKAAASHVKTIKSTHRHQYTWYCTYISGLVIINMIGYANK